MLLTEWNWEDAKKVWQEEAREDGREEGMKLGVVKGRQEGIKLGVAKGRQEGMKDLILRLLTVMPQEQAAKTLQMTVEEIQKITKS